MWWWKRRGQVRREREGASWPIVDGRIVSHEVVELPKKEHAETKYSAMATNSYFVRAGAEIEYYSGTFSRGFDDGGAAGVWLRALLDRQIPIHVEPGKPKVSVVLPSEIDRLFGPAAGDGSTPSLLQAAAAGWAAKFPRRLYLPAEWGAMAAAICFCAAFCDHLYRLLAGRPLHPQLAPVLWGIVVLLGLPFWFWYQKNTGISIAKWPGATAPTWLLILTRLLNGYVACEWIIRLVIGGWWVRMHMSPARLSPMDNGALLALLFGNAAGSLFAALERTEDPSNPSTWSVVSE
jgi:hypothetical protein